MITLSYRTDRLHPIGSIDFSFPAVLLLPEGIQGLIPHGVGELACKLKGFWSEEALKGLDAGLEPRILNKELLVLLSHEEEIVLQVSVVHPNYLAYV